MARLIMFNKPFAVLSQFTDRGSETKRQTLSDFVDAPGVYSAGDVEGGYKQIVTASGQGAEAAMTIFEDLINPYWLN